jgi:hypothetical protein
MLIHAMISWPEIIQENLWPYALRLAVDLHNCTPTPSGLSPEEIFTGVKNRNRLLDFHPFGCLIFILDPTLQQGHKIPRWKPCSRVGVYLGLSPNHASTVPLVLSTTTGLVSPQFHVVFDDHFTTTKCLHDNILPTNWPTLLSTSSSKYTDDTFDPTPFTDSTWLHDDSSSSQRGATAPSTSFSLGPSLSTSSSATSSPPQMEHISTTIAPPPGWNSDHRYESRFHKRFTALTSIDDASTAPFDESLYSAFISVQDSYPIHSITDISFIECYACAAPSNPDILHYGSMLCDPDRSSFELDMQREMSDLLRTNTVELSHRNAVPSGMKILSSIWSFCCKRAPDWSILKYKSRLCPHGGQQIEGEHFWETYAPVVNWRTVRLVLILSLLSNLKSRQLIMSMLISKVAN